MTEKYTIGEILRFVLRRVWIIVLCTILVGLVLGAPKMMTTGESKHTLQISEMVSYKDHASNTDPRTGMKQYQSYRDLLTQSSTISEFCQLADQKYDMDKFKSGWGSMSDLERAKWFSEALTCLNVANSPVYEFDFTMTYTQGNAEYVAANAKAFFSDFISFTVEKTKLLSPTSDVTVISYSEMDEQSTMSGGKKYLVIGAMLGFLLSAAGVFVWFFASRKVTSKAYYAAVFGMDDLRDEKNPAYSAFCYLINRAQQTGSRVLCVSDTTNRPGFPQQLLEQFQKYGYQVAAADLTANQSAGLANDALPSELSRQLKTPGKAAQAAAQLCESNDYAVLFVDTPAENLVAGELAAQSACTMLVAAVGKTYKQPLETSLVYLRRLNPDGEICIVWVK